jgi:hypothetical protein
MSNLFDGVKWQATTGGTGAFTVGAALPSFLTPAAASVPNSTSDIPYTAFVGVQREWGTGTYNAGVFSRDTVRGNSLGTTATINFTSAPVVFFDVQAEDIGDRGSGLPGTITGGSPGQPIVVDESGTAAANSDSLTASNGNSLTLNGGVDAGDGAGAVAINGGPDAGSGGGEVYVQAGSSNGGVAGFVSIRAGDGTGQTGIAGGQINVRAGAGGFQAAGGNFQMTGGDTISTAAVYSKIVLLGIPADDGNGNQAGGGVQIASGTAAGNANGGDVTVTIGGGAGSGRQGQLLLLNLPTADPHIVNALWSNAGVLTISAG